MYGIIYKATGPSGLVYIGQTINSLATRKAHHALRTKKGDKRSAFHIALLEHGFSAFQWEQIDTAETAEELDAKEKHWIAHYQSDNPAHGYNGTDGGIKTVYSPETRRKISEAKKGKPNGKKGKRYTPEHCRHISEANKGRVISEEHRRKISDTLKRKGIKPPTEKGRIPWNKGKTGVYTEEALQKMSEAKRRGKRKSI